MSSKVYIFGYIAMFVAWILAMVFLVNPVGEFMFLAVTEGGSKFIELMCAQMCALIIMVIAIILIEHKMQGNGIGNDNHEK